MVPAIYVVVLWARFFSHTNGCLCFLFGCLWVVLFCFLGYILGMELSLAVVGLYRIHA